MRDAATILCGVCLWLVGCGEEMLVADELAPVEPAVRADTDADGDADASDRVGAAGPSRAAPCAPSSPCLPASEPGRAACAAALAVLTREERVYEASGCVVLASASADGGDGRPRRALVVEVLHGDMGRPLALVVDDAEGFRGVVRVLEIWEGINGDEDARVDELRLEDVVGDAEPEALLRTTSTLEDSACTEPLAWDTRRSDLVVCTLPARAAPTCTDRIPLRFHEIERSYDDGDRPRVRRVTRYATRVVLERDGIVVVRESGRVPRAARGVMGRYRITGANVLLRPRDAADGDGARAP